MYAYMYVYIIEVNTINQFCMHVCVYVCMYVCMHIISLCLSAHRILATLASTTLLRHPHTIGVAMFGKSAVRLPHSRPAGSFHKVVYHCKFQYRPVYIHTCMHAYIHRYIHTYSDFQKLYVYSTERPNLVAVRAAMSSLRPGCPLPPSATPYACALRKERVASPSPPTIRPYLE